MLIWITLKTAIKSLIANKMRSVLAMLGIIIGVGAVIGMLAVGSGAQQQILGSIAAMGTNLVVVRPGQRDSGGVRTTPQQTLKLEDALALRDVKGVEAVSPVVNGSAQLKFMSQNARTSVLGVAPTYFGIRSFELDRGRLFGDGEADGLARVAVIGPTTEKNLFLGRNAVGETMKLNGMNFRVVGVLKGKGDKGFFNPDDQVLIPYSTAMQIVFGTTYVNEIDLQGENDRILAGIQRDVTEILRRRHRLTPEEDDDFQISNQKEILETAGTTLATFRILMGAIGGISLLVGGIGIMNIMLVTVTERTREIGVRKAIGATNWDIQRQFLIEAIIMSGVGGLLGASVGIGLAVLVRSTTEIPALVTPGSLLLAMAFSGGVGVFFGFYPAYRAAQLDPIEALRYE